MAKEINGLPSVDGWERATVRSPAAGRPGELEQLRRTVGLARQLLADLEAKSATEEGLPASELDQRMGIAYAVERFRDVLEGGRRG